MVYVMKSNVPVKSFIVLLILLIAIWLPYLLGKFSLLDSLIITTSMIIGSVLAPIIINKIKKVREY
jgi:hypothetical protein